MIGCITQSFGYPSPEIRELAAYDVRLAEFSRPHVFGFGLALAMRPRSPTLISFGVGSLRPEQSASVWSMEG